MSKYKVIVMIQFLTIVFVSIAPLIEHGFFDFSIRPLTFNNALGLSTEILGVVVLFVAVRTMSNSFKVNIKPKEDGGLVTHGIFKYTRNPIYFGGLLMAFGWSLSQSSFVGIFATLLMLITLLIKVSFEEKELLKMFGEPYLKYKKKTSKIIPFLV